MTQVRVDLPDAVTSVLHCAPEGICTRAGDWDGEAPDWDMRASMADWLKWVEKGIGMMGMGTAYATGKLKFKTGDYGAMIKDPRMAGPFVKSFNLMKLTRRSPGPASHLRQRDLGARAGGRRNPPARTGRYHRKDAGHDPLAVRRSGAERSEIDSRLATRRRRIQCSCARTRAPRHRRDHRRSGRATMRRHPVHSTARHRE